MQTNMRTYSDTPVTVCSICGGTIYEGEFYGEFTDSRSTVICCTDCAEDEWRILKDYEKLERLGYELHLAELPELSELPGPAKGGVRYGF